MKAKINIITLAVRDMAASKSFYEQAFDFMASDVSEDLCVFPLEGELFLTLQQVENRLPQALPEEPQEAFSAGFILSHNVDSKEEVDVVVMRAEAAGAQKVTTLIEEWGYSVTIIDLDGHHWEILFTE
jgi:uncharacterized protein